MYHTYAVSDKESIRKSATAFGRKLLKISAKNTMSTIYNTITSTTNFEQYVQFLFELISSFILILNKQKNSN